MIDGSFPCYRGKYAKRLFSSHLDPRTAVCVFLLWLADRETFITTFRAFIVLCVKREAEIRSPASLAEPPLVKN